MVSLRSIVITIESFVLTLVHLLADPMLLPGSAAQPVNSMNRQYSAPASNQLQAHQLPARQRSSQWPAGSRGQESPNSLNINHTGPAALTGAAHSQQQPRQHSSSAPSSACVPPSMQHPYSYPSILEQPPPTYEQFYRYQQFLEEQRRAQAAAAAPTNTQRTAANANDDEEEESLSESEVDEGEQPLDKWACIMCTFLNHPQLNVCEACENVRIQPGMIRIVHSGADNANNASSPATAAPTIA